MAAASSEKGWVRDAVLTHISKNPATLTELARELHVAKSTVDYHIRCLLDKGLIEISETRYARGGVLSKLYSLGTGAIVLLPAAEEKEESRHLEEVFETRILAWEPKRDGLDVLDLQILLYRLFLHMFRVTRSQHQAIMKTYGRRTGAIVVEGFKPTGKRATLSELIHWARRSGVAQAEVVDIPGSQYSVLIFNDCLGSWEHPSRACWFLEGIVEGIIQARLGGSCAVSRLEEPGIPACCLVVGRGKRLEAAHLREAILSSPIHSFGRSLAPRVR